MSAKITELPVITAAEVTADDVLLVDSLSGTPESKQISVGELTKVVVAGIAPTDSTVAFDDDFLSSPATAWSIEAENGGEVVWGGSASALGFPSSGYAGLRCSTDGGSHSEIVRRGTALMLDGDRPIEVEAWLSVRNNSALVSDDECQWLLGVRSADGEQAVALYAYLDGGDRVYALATILDGAPTGIDSATFPGDLGEYVRVRIRVTPTGSTLEVGVEDGAYAVLATSTTAPTECVYFPVVSVSRDTGAGNRTIAVDRFRGSSARAVSMAGTPIDDSSEITPPVTDHGALTGLADDDHTQYLLANGTRSLTGNLSVSSSVTIDGRDLSVDGTKLDGIESGADVTDATNVVAALAANVGSVAFNNQTLAAIADPSGAQHAATKNYVDTTAGYIQPDASVGDDHTLVAGDHNHLYRATGASGLEVVVPSDLPLGMTVAFQQQTIGQPVTVVGSGVTLQYPAAFVPTTADLYSVLVIVITSSSTAIVMGDLAAA